MNKLVKLFVALGGVTALVVPAIAFAASTPTLNQTVNAGTLTMDILQTDGVTPVASPTVGFSALNKSFSCQTSTATLGDTNNKIYITNLAANGGFTLALAATGGTAATWSDGATHTYKYNDPAGTGCTNGQMTVDPSVATVTLDCSSNCVSTNVTKGSSTAYISPTTPTTLMSNSSAAAWKGYLTGVSLSQKVPAGQTSGSYTLPMTLTVTAL